MWSTLEFFEYIRWKKDKVMDKLIYALTICLLITLGSLYTIHIWSDCLEENTTFTCMRMLSK